MTLKKLVLYLLVAILALMVVSATISAVFAVLGIIWAVMSLVATLLVLGALGYGGYKLYTVFTRGNEDSYDVSERSRLGQTDWPTDVNQSESTDPVESLKEKYTRGELTEAEFERRLERELDETEYDSIDRELQRER